MYVLSIIYQITYQMLPATTHAHANTYLLGDLAFSLHCALPNLNVDETHSEVLCKSLFQNDADDCQIL